VAVALCVACTIRAPRVSNGRGAPCISANQCQPEAVCFLGECRASSSQLSIVLAEVHPPSDQQLGTVQLGGIDLRQTPMHDFELKPLLTAAGAVLQQEAAGGPVAVPGAAVVVADLASPIPDRVAKLSAQSDASGNFSLHFPSSTWGLSVLPPAPTPPYRYSPPLTTGASGLQFVLPLASDLTTVTGTLNNSGLPLASASVTAVDSAGKPLSTPAVSDPAGAFTLLLPPGSPQFFLQVGPVTNPAPSQPPVPAYTPRGPYSGTVVPPLDLGPLPAPATLSGTVVDARGQPVVSPHVYALSLDATNWTILRQATAAADGSFSLSLRAGNYAIEAAPGLDPTQPGLSGDQQEVLLSAASAPVKIVCPDKSVATGVVRRPDGQRAGPGYQVTATRFPDRLVTSRMAQTTPTDSNGVFTISGDQGSYQVEVTPPPETGLPRRIVSLDLSGSGAVTQLPDLQLAQPSQAVGTVYTGTGKTPVAGASVSFFALDSTGLRSVLIGSTLTDALGHYTAVLPDVSAPAP
jgi:hypothetical protein